MRRLTIRFLPTGALTLAALVFGPAAAEAQLFPDITIKRKRPCPPAEDPRYRLVREQFYGYYPTCWRRFPAGWGCPSPDAPDWQASLRERPLDYSTLEGGTGDLGGEDAAPALPPADGGSPFETPRPGVRPGPGAPPAGDNLPALPSDDDPFRMDSPAGGGDAMEPPAGGADAGEPGPQAAGPAAPLGSPAPAVPATAPALPAPVDVPPLGAPVGGQTNLAPAVDPARVDLGSALPGPDARPVDLQPGELSLAGESPVAPPLGPPAADAVADARALVSQPVQSLPPAPSLDPRSLATDPVAAPAPAPATANAAAGAPRRSSSVGNFLGRMRRR